MPISIGIITARQSMDNIRQTEQSMKQHCKISYFPYDTLDELRHQYTKAAAKSDGLLFSGPFPHDYICENIGRITLPCRCIDLMDRDYYLVIAVCWYAIQSWTLPEYILMPLWNHPS